MNSKQQKEGQNSSTSNSPHDEHDALDNIDVETSEDSFSDSSISCNICEKKFSGYVPYKQHVKSSQHLRKIDLQKKTAKLKEDLKKLDISKDLSSDESDPSAILEPIESCKICNKIFYNELSYHQHLKSKKHIRKKNEKKLIEIIQKNKNVSKNIKLSPNTSELSNDDNNKIPSEENAQGNLGTVSLEDEDEEEEEESPIYTCKECKKAFSGETPYIQHMVSPTHKKKIKQIKLLKKYRDNNKQLATSIAESEKKQDSSTPQKSDSSISENTMENSRDLLSDNMLEQLELKLDSEISDTENVKHSDNSAASENEDIGATQHEKKKSNLKTISNAVKDTYRE